jgi:CheY-like chemotaxis protein
MIRKIPSPFGLDKARNSENSRIRDSTVDGSRIGMTRALSLLGKESTARVLREGARRFETSVAAPETTSLADRALPQIHWGMDRLNSKRRISPTAIDTGSDFSPELVRQSILVVDDEENFLTLLRWFLTQRGYDVCTASSADKALCLLNTHSFEVALLDVKLGTADGITLLEQLIQRVPTLKAIIMTAYPTAGSIKQAFDKGANRYFTKPVDLQELAEAIQMLF